MSLVGIYPDRALTIDHLNVVNYFVTTSRSFVLVIYLISFYASDSNSLESQ